MTPPAGPSLQALVGKDAVITLRREFAQALEASGWMTQMVRCHIMAVEGDAGLWVKSPGPLLGQAVPGGSLFLPTQAVAGIVVV